ncbi:MAG: hypothetical protein KDK24_09330 [Pseudooceanicola sp.]|nr:hypothetical protein [Pseudooceanicola sp.]
MANQDLHSTYVERDRIETRERSGAGAFIIGGIVVALLVLIWLFSMGGSDGTVTTVPATGTDTVIIDNTAPAPAADATAPAADTTAPAADSTTTVAPEATAPADVTEPTTVPAVPTAPSGN